MKAKIIAGENEHNIAQYLEYRLGPHLLNYENLVIVDVNAIERHRQLFTDRAGLQIAKECAQDPDKVVVLLVAEPDEVLWTIPEFIELMDFGNVGYTEFLAPQHIPSLYLILSARKKSHWVLAIKARERYIA